MTNTKALELAKRIDAEFSQVMMDSEGTAREGNTETLAWAVIDLSAQLAERDAQLEAVKPLVDAAHGLSFGTDWNNGNHAKLHGYRRKLLDALPDAYKATRQPTQDKGEL